VLWSEEKEYHYSCFDPVVALSPDGKRVAACHLDQVLRCWDVDSKQLLWEAKSKTSTPLAFFSPDGHTVITAAIGKDTVTTCLWDASTGKLLEGNTPAPKEKVYPIGCSPEGRFLAFATGTEEVVLWERAPARVAFRLASPLSLHDGVSLVVDCMPTNF